MKILVIGGMGIIGGAISEAAAKKQLDVSILSRRPLEGKYNVLGIKGITGNWKDDAVATKAVQEGFDVIVDTLVFNRLELIRDTNIVNGYCKQYIYISTDAVYNHPQLNTTESSEIDIQKLYWNYGYDKRDAELYLTEHSHEFSFFWTIIRPTMTYGDTRLPVGFASRKNEYTLLERILNNKPIIVFDDPDSIHSICHSSTFGESVVDTFLNREAEGQFFHIADNKNYRYSEVFDAISKALGVTPKLIYISPEYLKKYKISRYQEIIFDKNPSFTLDNSKVKSISPNTDFEVSIISTMNSTIKHLMDSCSSQKADTEYNLLSDSILSNYKKMKLTEEENKIVSNYYLKMNLGSKLKISVFKMKCKIKSFVRPLVFRILHKS